MAQKDSKAQAMALAGHQRRHLRKLAHPLKPIVHIGESGISDAAVGALNDALDRHELVKVKLHQPEDKKASAAELARRTGSEICGLVGHMVILYRADPDDPKIEWPRPVDGDSSGNVTI